MKLRFRVSLTLSIIVVIIAFFAMTMMNVRWVTEETGRQTASDLFSLVSKSVDSEVNHMLKDSKELLALLTAHRKPEAVLGEDWSTNTALQMIEALRSSPNFYSVYYGFEDDSFFQVIAIRGSDPIRFAHEAPAGAEWILRKLRAPGSIGDSQEWRFLDKDLQEIGRRQDLGVGYKPSERPWYDGGLSTNGAYISDAYLFNSSKKPGFTVSQQLQHSNGVAGVDVTLETLGHFLDGLSISDNSAIALLDNQRRILAQAPLADNIEMLSGLTSANDTRSLMMAATLDGNAPVDDRWLVEKRTMGMPSGDWHVVVIAPSTDFMGSFVALQDRLLLVSMLGLLVFLPVALYVSGKMSSRLVQLVGDARKISHLDFRQVTRRESRIIEFSELENNFTGMRDALQGYSAQLVQSQDKLNRLIELGIAMSAERDTDKVMTTLLDGARELANADGGSLYLVRDNQLEFQIILNQSLNIYAGGTGVDKPDLPPVPLYLDDGSVNQTNVVSHAVHAAETIDIPDVYENEDFNFTGTRKFDEINGYRSQSFLTIPLKPRGGNVIGALQLLNAMDSDGNVVPFDVEIRRFLEALAAQAATVIYNRELLDSQERLMDSLIQLLAGAIDTKSPYTGGHCERVPELATMLARKASASNEGSLADFSFNTQEEWREFTIGAWLHDCGKVVTPEYVVDKATKLETIYNRIHEVRTRFEVLLRDARIACLEGVLNGGDAASLEAEFDKVKASLMDDFAFVAECNIGGEFMAPEKIERLEEIAQKNWTRYFDVKLGLSHEEEPLYASAPDGPATEKLLDDKPWHILEHQSNFGAQYEGLDFKIDIPEHLYNRGEMHNLRVQRGTLTAEERFKINEHIMQTIAMLEQLPFPDHLKRVPEYAGTHHETMIGTGYPRKLDASELSIPARVMAIADIFEALTASDRPYKKAKTLSESVKILSFFKKDQHIDGELFDLFLTSGVYKDYAERYLLPHQMDEVDIEQYLG